MKRLRDMEPCLVLIERGTVTTVRWRKQVWTVVTTLDIWSYRGEWWRDARLEGESRTYHVLATKFGEIELCERREAEGGVRGWFVVGWWD